MAMERLFQLMKDKGASDLFLAVNSPIQVKINGSLIAVNQQRMDQASILALLSEVVAPERLAELQREHELNLGIQAVGIGGVLEPMQANPTIIEDNCFIGARSEIVEGVIVEENSVISMGVYIGQSTKIYNRETGEVSYGRVPSGSVVVSGSLPSDDGKYSLYCAVIVKRVDAKTRAKTGINELLRGI
jgi:UDP-3-O-[3-hydroxymyristoyl] glucosamine N-acyltransferase